MNHEKARDFFSAYYEESLEPGLRQAFEQRLNGDATLQAEYKSFVETMDELGTLRYEEIETPSFLSDRIASRLEQVQERRRPIFAAWSHWTRGLAFAGLAAVAIVGTALSLKSGGKIGEGGVVGSATNRVDYTVKNGELTVSYHADSDHALLIGSGGQTTRVAATPDGTNSPLHNANPAPATFTVQIEGEGTDSILVVPGTDRIRTRAGDGTLIDFAKAVAGFYHVPVRVAVANPAAHTSWSFDQPDARKAADNALGNSGYSVDIRDDGLLCILDR